MKKLLLLLPLTLCLLGCPSSITTPTPPAALAPGYTSPTDQQFGQALAAARALVNQAVIDYAKLTPSQKAQEKNPLNAFVAAVNVADSIYEAYHVGQATPAQVIDAINQVNAAQLAFTAIATGSKSSMECPKLYRADGTVVTGACVLWDGGN